MAAASLAFAMLALWAPVATEVRAQTPAVDPAATQILKRMTGYLAGLRQFSVRTQNTLEDQLDSGQRVDHEISASVLVRRPNKLRAERIGDVISQVFYYDGKTLTLYTPSAKVYATEPAPERIEEVLDFARESLGLTVPAADLVYRDAFALLMKDVTFAALVGKSVIGGVKCDHVLFSRPGVDFQVWVTDSGPPRANVVTIRHPARLSLQRSSERKLERSSSRSRCLHLRATQKKRITFLRAIDFGSRDSGRTHERSQISVVATSLSGCSWRCPLLPVPLVSDANAIIGVRRRTAVVVGTEVHAADEAQIAQSQQQTAVAQQQAAAAQQEAAAAKQQAAAAAPAPPLAAAGKPLPMGTVVAALPAGCTSTPVGGVEYYYCGGNFYRAVFQGNTLVYVTAQP
jgi:hypothetical protein